MKKSGKGIGLPCAILLSGIVAMILRRQLYLTAVDARGLLMRYTLLEGMLLLLTGLVGAVLVWVLRKDRGTKRYEDNYSASVFAALGHGAAALGIAAASRHMASGQIGYLGAAWQLLGIAAPACLILAGILRIFGKKPFFLLHVVPCLFLLLHVINSYRGWSSNPQMQDYLFALLASVSLTLFAHHTAAFEADMGNRKWVLGTGMLAVYMCLAELGWSDHAELYAGGMLWALTGMCRMIPVQEKEKD